MPGLELTFEAVDKASPTIQRLSKEMLEAALRSDRFAKEIFDATSKVEDGLKKIPPKAQQASQSISAIQQASQQLTQQLLGFATVAGVTTFFKQAAQAALEEQEALRRLSFAVEAIGGSFASEKERIIAFAQEQQALTRFSDTQTFEALGRLTRVTGDLGQAMQAARLAFGLASASGKDLNSILDLLGPILNGDATRLRALKLEFGAFIGNAKSAQEVIDVLSKRFLGAAETEKGFAKELIITRNRLSDFQETVGTGVLPAFRFLLGIVEQGAKVFEFLGIVIADFAARSLVHIRAFGEEVKAIFTLNFGKLPEISRQAEDQIAAIAEETGNQIVELEERFSKQRIRTIQNEGAIKARVTEDSIEKAKKESEEKKRAAEDAHEVLVRLDAERLELEGETLESKRLLIEMEKEERFRALDELRAKSLITEDELLAAKLNATEAAILKFNEAAEEQKRQLSEVEQAAKQVSESMANAVGDAVADMILEGKTFEAAMKSVFNTVLRTAIETFTRVAIEAAIARSAAQGVAGAASGFAAAGAVGVFAGVAATIFKGVKLQEGGIVTRPTIALVGEAGREAVIPLERGGSVLGGNISINITQNNNITVSGFGDDQAREIMRRISEVTRSGASEGAELVKSILARQGRFAREAV
ncbi:MAG: hypothetical protein HYT79_02570 [Elusimicrobia bacterium]|nr:hypothetical protein [Elusimicrobiota bacterium]